MAPLIISSKETIIEFIDNQFPISEKPKSIYFETYIYNEDKEDLYIFVKNKWNDIKAIDLEVIAGAHVYLSASAFKCAKCRFTQVSAKNWRV